MNTLRIATITLAVGFVAAIGCGSDDGGNKTDAPVIVPGTGGSAGPDAGTGGMTGSGGSMGPDAPVSTGGVMGPDAPMATGGTGGSMIDGPMAMLDGGTMDAPMTGAEVHPDTGMASEAAPATNICTGLTAAACDLAIRNAAVDNTVVAQDVPVISPTTYPACSQ